MRFRISDQGGCGPFEVLFQRPNCAFAVSGDRKFGYGPVLGGDVAVQIMRNSNRPVLVQEGAVPQLGRDRLKAGTPGPCKQRAVESMVRLGPSAVQMTFLCRVGRSLKGVMGCNHGGFPVEATVADGLAEHSGFDENAGAGQVQQVFNGERGYAEAALWECPYQSLGACAATIRAEASNITDLANNPRWDLRQGHHGDYGGMIEPLRHLGRRL